MNEQALRAALAIADKHLPHEVLEPSRAALDRLDERARREPDRTVVALVGATGSGKSSLVNAIVGADVARVAATRPTTSRARAVIYGGGAESLLDWLDVAERVEVPGPEGAILIDLPDVDSVVTAHREVTGRLAQSVDVLVWVLDPEKYADAVMHRAFIEPFATHGDVAFAVINQVDRLSERDRVAMMDDVTRIFASYGLPGEVLAASARTGEGIGELRERIFSIASARTARAARARADVARAARGLAEITGDTRTRHEVSDERLIAASAQAAGVRLVERAVSGSTLRTGRSLVGWPIIRWLSRFRPDPLRRLHLDRDAPAELVRTSLPGPTPIQESAVRSEAHRMVDGATRGIHNAWRSSLASSMDERIDVTLNGLDQAIVGVDLGMRTPRWWSVVWWLQWIALVCGAAGGLWLTALWVLRYLALPEPELPMAGPIPWPTALLLGGVLFGILLGALSMVFVRMRARRVSRRAAHRLNDSVAAHVRTHFVGALETELSEWSEFRAVLADASNG